ncbi:hypothetical protein RhiirA4_481213 [Rhizophagus irregularis]|uniref:Uncharacterized protein n=1 Tax=Rhizophagus irregularis TaxID=588596 RepID=A0A2I1HJ58_9GLOM|nr:hypothetical protein RhiirA4_481213 [Rhizophagus irregularis]
MEKGRDKTHNEYENLEKVLCNKYVSLKDFSSGDPVSSDDEYEDLEKTWRILKKFLEGVIEESSIQSELNNGESLFEIDRDAKNLLNKMSQTKMKTI